MYFSILFIHGTFYMRTLVFHEMHLPSSTNFLISTLPYVNKPELDAPPCQLSAVP